MTREEVFTKTVSILSEYVRDKSLLEGDLESKDILKDLKINSARFVDLVLDIEDAFEIILEDSISEKIITVGDTVDLIMEIANA